MGAKDSKQCCITYEEAVKRVTEPELKRIKEAFKRLSNQNGYIDKHIFVKDVLGDGVPGPISEYIYAACGGTQKGIAFRELLCGLVLLTRGLKEEKIKFLFSLYVNENSAYIFYDEFLRMLHICENGYDENVGSLFIEKDRVTYEEFKDWIQKHPEVTSLSRWLVSEPCTVTLNNELETPSFYQTLAGVTHLEETDIMELEKRYWTLKGQSRTGKLDEETLRPLISPPIPLSVCAGVFNAFDENRDNHIDFKEMACGISAATRGPLAERQKFCFKVFDLDRDGYLSPKEMKEMVDVLLFIHRENYNENDSLCTDSDEESLMNELLLRASEQGLTIGEYLIWTVENPLSLNFLNLLFQVCHIVLGLRPASEKEEGKIFLSWLRREEKRGFSVGQFWYLISYDWWCSWEDYVKASTFSEGKLESSARQGRCRSCNVNHSVPENYQSGIQILSPDQLPCVLRRNAIRPGPIDNSALITPYTHKVGSLTGEGGKLKSNLRIGVEPADVKLVPDSLFRALSLWYGSSPTLPRQVILPKNSDAVELELYPLTLRLLRHQLQPPKTSSPPQSNSWSGMVGGYGTASLISSNDYSYVSQMLIPPKRYLAYTATFSRMATIYHVYDFLSGRLHIRHENMRLWHYFSDNNMKLIEDEAATLEDLDICDEDQFLIEVRNKDLTWPEEIGSLALNQSDLTKQSVMSSPPEKGATGLNNLGNTCFMNASLQCCSNTRILTRYFMNNYHLYELNRFNPLGMKGHIAKQYGDLIQEIWSGSAKAVAPIKLRWTIAKYAPRFSGNQQHDSQELLAFLLDGLHEDLNRVHVKPYVELKDSDGRPDIEVAQEAWENHLIRNKSIIVDLFHGQLKSEVKCKECGHESVRFDPFNYLSLPLPMESYLHIQAIVIFLDGSIPKKYGLQLNMDDTYAILKNQLSELCGIPGAHIKLTELIGAQIKSMPGDEQKIKLPQGTLLYAYELPSYFGSGSLSRDEECLSINSDKIQRESQMFQAIQRSVLPGNNREASSVCQDSLISYEDKESPGVSEEASVQMLPDSSTNASPSDSFDTSLSSQPFFIIAFHRKMLRLDIYFLSSQKSKASLFGVPVIVPCRSTTSHQDLYQSVWVQVARLVSPLPPSPSEKASSFNHAMDCDDSLGYDFPFVLKAVNSTGKACAWCPWYRFCRGCRIQCSDEEFNFSSSHLAIDWDPTALHLRYQTLQERAFEEHVSVTLSRSQELEPIQLDYCLENFTKEEHLGEEEKYYCSKCAQHQLASKKLQIWKLPPILIIHLKRFQYVNGKWVKSQKVVNFPSDDFDPTSYLATIPRETILKYHEINSKNSKDKYSSAESICDTTNNNQSSRDRTSNIEINGEAEIGLTINNNNGYDTLHDFHQHKLSNATNPFDLRYRLYAIVCHSGILGGGHYVAYACNPSGKWYYFNDSSCKEVSDMDTSSAYMLFYERKNICDTNYMPDVTGLKVPDLKDLDEDFELDFKKICNLM